MSDTTNNNASSEWIIEPPGPGEFSVAVYAGTGAELSPAVREALMTLADQLHAEDAKGYLLPPPSIGTLGTPIPRQALLDDCTLCLVRIGPKKDTTSGVQAGTTQTGTSLNR